MFTRTKSKRTKAAPASSMQEPILEEPPPEPKPGPARKSRKKSTEPSAPPAKEREEAAAPRRRSTRNSGDKLVEPQELQIPKRRTKRASTEKTQTTQNLAAAEREAPRRRSPSPGRAKISRKESHSPDRTETSGESTKIALPFADTPIIRRNKEMRKGSGESRRSSLSMRGRRASSLIDSGTSNGSVKLCLSS